MRFWSDVEDFRVAYNNIEKKMCEKLKFSFWNVICYINTIVLVINVCIIITVYYGIYLYDSCNTHDITHRLVDKEFQVVKN